MKINPGGLQLILDQEVGGGRKYYDKFCLYPIVPGGKDTQSGVTIGIGWDLGQNGHQGLVEEWQEYLSIEELAKLATVVGLKGDEAKRWLPQMRAISIPWEKALAQFQEYTIPRYAAMTQRAFPGIEKAPQCVQESLLSLVFNRGTSMKGPRRIEMIEIRKEIEAGNWSAIPAELRAMKRLWPQNKGLRDRRETEAKHIEAGLSIK